jgi:uncharacterized membrane protein YgdD (TMEM256/DUF423 family)
MKNRIGIFSAFSACLAVVILALAAHALPKFLPLQTVDSIESAGYLQLIHAIAFIALAPQSKKFDKKFSVGLNLMALGSGLFSYSIYTISLKYMNGFAFMKFIWPITPLGGLVLCAGWFLIAVAMLKQDQDGI